MCMCVYVYLCVWRHKAGGVNKTEVIDVDIDLLFNFFSHL